MSTSNFPTSVELHSDGGEWAGLYVDGVLDTYGDCYHAEERVYELFGVKLVHGSSWMLGTSRNPAKTLDEIAEYDAKHDAVLAKAAGLREKAEELLRQASELESGCD